MSANPPEEELEAIAAQWIARRDRGMAPGDKAALAAWLSSDERHARAFARCEAAWGALPALRRLPPAELAGLMPPKKHPGRRWLPPFVTALAAALIFLAFVLRPPPAPISPLRHYRAQNQAGTRIVLPDGSAVELRRGSEIAFSDQPSVRRVDLVRGEAHFTVSALAARPFIVRANGIVVRDLDTAFDVRLESDRVAVLVTQGRVEVSGETRSGAPTLMTAGEQAVVRTAVPAARIDVRETSRAEAKRVLAWRDGKRQVFLRTRLSEAAAELNHYNRRQLTVADARTGSVLVSGSVEPDDTEEFISLLETGFGVRAERRSEYEIVLRRRLPLSPPAASEPDRAAAGRAAGAPEAGWLTFNRAPLSEVVSQFNRRNRRRLIIADAAVGSLLISGSVEADNVAAFLSMLETGFGISVEHRAEGEIVLLKSP